VLINEELDGKPALSLPIIVEKLHGFGQPKFFMVVDFRLQSIYTTASSAFKNNAQFKSDEN
jgi:hypothetical protein